MEDYDDASIVVIVFMCNHCPFVIHVKPVLVRLAREYAGRGVQFIGVNSNDASLYPDDSFDRMQEDAAAYGYPFPYLHDESQSVAKAYGAVCTPDVFVYGPTRQLQYHGQIDDTRPGGAEAHGDDLRHALDELIEFGTVTTPQSPSIGCNIKWKRSESPG